MKRREFQTRNIQMSVMNQTIFRKAMKGNENHKSAKKN